MEDAVTGCSHRASHLNTTEILKASAHGLEMRLAIVGDSTIPCYAREGEAIRRELARRVGCAVGP